jgi:glycosyltransferase 2 family protein
MSKKAIIIKATFSVVFFMILFSVVQGKEFLLVISQIDTFFFTVSFLLLLVMIPSSCLKWKILLEQQGEGVDFLFLLRIYLIGYFFSNLMPSNIGGDLVRSYYVGRHIGSQSQAAVSVFIERFSGILLLLMLTILAPLMKPELYRHLIVFLPACGAFILLVIFACIAQFQEPLKFPDKIARFILSSIKKENHTRRVTRYNKLVDNLEGVYQRIFGQAERFHRKLLDAVKYLRSNKRSLLKIILLTLFFYFMTWVNVYVAFMAFGVRLDFWTMSALIPTCMVVGMIPVTLLGNIGFTESVYIAVFGLIGVSSSAALIMSLLLRLKLFVIGTVGYFFYLTYRSKTVDFDTLQKSSREETGSGKRVT